MFFLSVSLITLKFWTELDQILQIHMLNPDVSFFENNVDPDQLASEKAI